MVDQLGARITDLSDPVEPLSQPEQRNRRASRTTNDRVNNPNDKDNFVPSGDDGRLNGVKGMLGQVGNMYASGVGNANPIFRFSIADAAIGLLNSAASLIQGALQDETIKNSPLKSIASTLNAVVNTLLGLIKGFSSEHLETIKGNRRIAQSFNDLGKPAG